MSAPDGRWPLAPQNTETTDQFSDPAERGRYNLLIEELRGSGEGREWRAKAVAGYSSRSAAREAALQLAYSYSPPNPLMPQSRQHMRLSPDEYLVIVTGMTAAFHFRVVVAEILPD